MNPDSPPGLPAQVRSLRNRLWRERCLAAMPMGLMSSAALLLAAASWHLWKAPLTVATWLPLALLPLLLQLLASLLWQRPGDDETVGIADSRLGLSALLISAWEASKTPAKQRSAGATAVLERFNNAGPIPLLPRVLASDRDRSRAARRNGATCLGLAGALFLFQLPGQQFPAAGPVATATQQADPANSLFSQSILSESRTTGMEAGGRPSRDTEVAIAEPDSTPPPDSQAFAPRPAGDEHLQALEGGFPAAASLADQQTASAESGRRSRGLKSGSAAGRNEARRAAPVPDPDDEAMERRYLEVARRIGESQAHLIAGSAGRDLVAAPGSPGERGAETGAAAAIAEIAGRGQWINRYTPAQRQAIAGYFEQLEEAR